MDKYIYGADTETLHGKPMTMQFYSEDTPRKVEEIFWVKPGNAAETFIKFCKGRQRKALHVFYVHNLAFDLPEFLWGHHPKLVANDGEFSFGVAGWKVTGVYGAPTFCRISNGHDVHIQIIDSWSFYRGSLDSAAKLFCPDLRKLSRPVGLGVKQFRKGDTAFEEYAMRDAEIDYHLGKVIERMHKKYNVQQCVSVADMSARIFRKMLTYDIPQPSMEIVNASVLAYHGGKNNVTVERGWYEGVTSLDIKSAYPHAMSVMPAFSDSRLYKRYRASSRRGNPGRVPEWGVFQVSGTVKQCDWPVLFSHGFKPLCGLAIDRVWVHGFELNEAISSGEFKPTRIHGYYYDHERDKQKSAMVAFVNEFYQLKEAERDPAMRYWYKTILNAPSGKFIQTRKKNTSAYTDVEAGITSTASDLVAGGLFHPFIAASITAHTRARIHRLEHEYDALHTATDSVFTQRNVSAGRNFDLQPQRRESLGSLGIEASDAVMMLLRNKLYILYSRVPILGKDGKPKTTPSSVFRGMHIIKSALHGFQGKVWDLEKLVATGRRSYKIERPNKLKESLKRGLTPNEFTSRTFVLKVGALPVYAAREASARRLRRR